MINLDFDKSLPRFEDRVLDVDAAAAQAVVVVDAQPREVDDPVLSDVIAYLILDSFVAAYTTKHEMIKSSTVCSCGKPFADHVEANRITKQVPAAHICQCSVISCNAIWVKSCYRIQHLLAATTDLPAVFRCGK